MKLVAALLTLILGSGAVADASERSTWRKIIKKCAGSDLIKKNVLYSGSTQLSTLTVLQRMSGGNLHPALTAEDFAAAGLSLPTLHAPDDPLSNCSSSSASKFSGAIKATVEGAGLQLSGDLRATVSRAKSATATISGYRWRRVKTKTLETQLLTPPLSTIKNTLSQPGTFLVIAALEARGFEATLEFDTSAATELNPHYSTGAPAAPVIAGGISVEWTSKRTLKLKAAEASKEFTIGMLLSTYKPTGFAAGSGEIVAYEGKLASTAIALSNF